MPIKNKKYTVGEKQYSIKQFSAVEGCMLLQEYSAAINAFCVVGQLSDYHVQSSKALPFKFKLSLSGQFLALLAFMDKIADTANPLVIEKRTKKATRVPLKDLLAGKTLHDVQSEEEYIPPSFEDVTQYTASVKASTSASLDEVFERFLAGVALNGEAIEVDSLTFHELAELITHVIVFNFVGVWSKKRFQLPDNWNAGSSLPAAVQKNVQNFSQSNIIYTITQSSLSLASHSDLMQNLNTEDAYDLNEAALVSYYQEVEAHKAAEREAKQNRGQ